MDGSGPRTIRTGLELQEEVTFNWEIDNANIVLGNDSLINSQKAEFCSGKRFGEQSKWTVSLETHKPPLGTGKKSIRFNYTLKTKPTAAILGDDFGSQMLVEITSLTPTMNYYRPTFKTTLWKGESTVNLCKVNNCVCTTTGVAIDDLIKGRDPWSINITLKLYSPKEQSGQTGSFKATLEQFQVDSIAKAKRDLLEAGIAGNPITGEAKIISSDGVRYSAPKANLAARSPVFATMFRTNMTEAIHGIVKLPDISGKTLKVLLGFINSGELLPDWKESGVIVELTNAAAKYQLTDLLEFLDLMLGQFCDLGNVAELLSLAHKLGLKTAEKELLKFIGGKGVSSAENFFQIMKVTSGMDSVRI